MTSVVFVCNQTQHQLLLRIPTIHSTQWKKQIQSLTSYSWFLPVDRYYQIQLGHRVVASATINPNGFISQINNYTPTFEVITSLNHLTRQPRRFNTTSTPNLIIRSTVAPSAPSVLTLQPHSKPISHHHHHKHAHKQPWIIPKSIPQHSSDMTTKPSPISSLTVPHPTPDLSVKSPHISPIDQPPDSLPNPPNESTIDPSPTLPLGDRSTESTIDLPIDLHLSNVFSSMLSNLMLDVVVNGICYHPKEILITCTYHLHNLSPKRLVGVFIFQDDPGGSMEYDSHLDSSQSFAMTRFIRVPITTKIIQTSVTIGIVQSNLIAIQLPEGVFAINLTVTLSDDHQLTYMIFNQCPENIRITQAIEGLFDQDPHHIPLEAINIPSYESLQVSPKGSGENICVPQIGCQMSSESRSSTHSPVVTMVAQVTGDIDSIIHVVSNRAFVDI